MGSPQYFSPKKKTQDPYSRERAKKDLRKSIDISGEMDYVKPSPRNSETQSSKLLPLEQLTQAQINAMNKKLGVNLNKKQLMSILNTIQTTDRKTDQQKKMRLNEYRNSNENLNLEFGLEEEPMHVPQRYNNYAARPNDYDEIKVYKQPQIVIAEDQDADNNNNNNNRILSQKPVVSEYSNTKSSLVDRKKLKWQQDLESTDKLHQQESYDNNKANNIPKALDKLQSELNFYAGGSTTNRSGLLSKAENLIDPPNVFKSTMTLAEKKRIQWQQEKENSDNLAKQYKSTNDLARLSSNAAQTQNQITNEDMSLLRKSNSLNSLLDQLSVNNQISEQQKPQRYSLVDKKRLKWEQDKEEDYNPFGKPGCGAAPIRKEQDTPVTHLPPQQAKTKKYQQSLEEYKQINETLAQIVAAENRIKQEQIEELRLQVNNQQANAPVSQSNMNFYNEQSKVPAAMRTSIMFGNVAYEDEIKKTKELERKKWLQDLEAQKKENLLDSQRKKNLTKNAESTTNELRQSWNTPLNSSGANTASPTHYQQQPLTSVVDEEKTFARTRNLLDPAQLDDLERKRNKNLQHMLEIEAQIAEKKRIKNLEDQVQVLSNLKIENEAKQLNSINQIHMEKKTKQPQYQNLDKILTANNGNTSNTNTEQAFVKKADTMASILQGDSKQFDQDGQAAKGLAVNDKTQDTYKKIQLAELAAAEEKHKRLLKRLQHGGHDTRNLENKFNEYKAKILSSTNPEMRNINNNNNTTTTGPTASNFTNSEVNNRNVFTSMSNPVEARLEHQKQALEKELKIGANENMSEREAAAGGHQGITEQKMKQIFKILREDTVGIPAEITEEHLKMILKSVGQQEQMPPQAPPKGFTQQKNQPKTQGNQLKKTQTKPNSADQKTQTNLKQTKPAGKPMWNAPNPNAKPKISNSQKDPFYQERKALAEERKQKRLELQQALVEKNNQKYNEYMQKKEEDTYEYSNRNQHRQSNASSSLSNMSNYNYHNNNNNNNNFEDTKVGVKPQNESIMNLLTKNLSKNIIYEDDEDKYLKAAPQMDSQRNRKPQQPNKYDSQMMMSNRNESSLRIEDVGSPVGFVPFMRTNEFLDPAHAASPIPPSRESSAIKHDREKARKAYFQNMKPADYGSTYQGNFDNINQQLNKNRMKDPLLNNGLVKNSPTPRQEQILSQLATLKQSLIAKQREVASSIVMDNNDMNGYDSDN